MWLIWPLGDDTLPSSSSNATCAAEGEDDVVLTRGRSRAVAAIAIAAAAASTTPRVSSVSTRGGRRGGTGEFSMEEPADGSCSSSSSDRYAAMAAAGDDRLTWSGVCGVWRRCGDARPKAAARTASVAAAADDRAPPPWALAIAALGLALTVVDPRG